MKKKKRVVSLGFVGVDSGQLVICDPAYIGSQYVSRDGDASMHTIHQHKDGSLWQFAMHKGVVNRSDVNPFPGTYDAVIPKYGKSPNEMIKSGEMFNSDINPMGDIPDGEFSYEGMCKITLNSENQGGQLNYKMGLPGVGVVFSTGYGDGSYPVFAEITDEGEWGWRIRKVWVEFF